MTMDLRNGLYKCPICRHMSTVSSRPSINLHISDNEDDECIICNNNILTQDNNEWVYCNLCNHRICSYCIIQIIYHSNNNNGSNNNDSNNNNSELIEIYNNNNTTDNNNELIEIYNNIETYNNINYNINYNNNYNELIESNITNYYNEPVYYHQL